MLQKGCFLDVRPLPFPRIKGAVSIPLEELPSRVFELPSRQVRIEIVDTGPEAHKAREWLIGCGRQGDLVPDFELGNNGDYRLWAPNRFLEETLPKVPIGSALDLACGSGRDAVYLASCGYKVTAVDHLEDALEFGRELSTRYLSGAQSIEWVKSDLDKPHGLGTFDLVICFYYLNRQLLSKVFELLNPGGHLIVETFTVKHRETFGKPRSEHLVLQEGELLQLSAGLRVRDYQEGLHEGRITARLWAENPIS